MRVLKSTGQETPCVSVLCLAYNHEKYLRKMLESVFTQKTDFPFEVLVHDDASTDSTPIILEEAYKEHSENLTVVFQDENQYSQDIACNPQFLFPRARGKYLAFCEGDDFWSDDHKLQRQYEALEKNPNCDMSVHAVQCVWESGSDASKTYPAVELSEGVLDKQWLIDSIISRGRYLFQTSSYFIRSSIMIDENGCRRDIGNLAFWGDEGYIRIALAAGDVYYIERAMSCYRQFSNGSWSTGQIGSEAAAQRCEKIRSVNREFDKLSGGEYREEVQLGDRFIDLLYLVSTGDVRSAYEYRRTEQYGFLSKYQRIEVEIGRIHPLVYGLIQRFRKLVMGIRRSR